MNFRLTTAKIVGCFLIALVLWVIVFSINSYGGPLILRSILEIHDMENIFSLGNAFIFLVEVVAIYLIWSFIERRELI